jgi:hypothetical protein
LKSAKLGSEQYLCMGGLVFVQPEQNPIYPSKDVFAQLSTGSKYPGRHGFGFADNRDLFRL